MDPSKLSYSNDLLGNIHGDYGEVHRELEAYLKSTSTPDPRIVIDYLGQMRGLEGALFKLGTHHKEDAAHDTFLTNLLSKEYARRELRDMAARRSKEGMPLSVGLIDIDYFKRVNDTWGHQAGDEVLVAVAREIKQTLRPGDEIGRDGGEEFLVVLPNHEEGTAIASRRIRDAIRALRVPVGRDLLSVTVSQGYATSDNVGYDTKELIYRADVALYQSKESGRDTIHIWKGESVGEDGESMKNFELVA